MLPGSRSWDGSFIPATTETVEDSLRLSSQKLHMLMPPKEVGLKSVAPDSVSARWHYVDTILDEISKYIEQSRWYVRSVNGALARKESRKVAQSESGALSDFRSLTGFVGSLCPIAMPQNNISSAGGFMKALTGPARFAQASCAHVDRPAS